MRRVAFHTALAIREDHLLSGRAGKPEWHVPKPSKLWDDIIRSYQLLCGIYREQAAPWSEEVGHETTHYMMAGVRIYPHPPGSAYWGA